MALGLLDMPPEILLLVVLHLHGTDVVLFKWAHPYIYRAYEANGFLSIKARDWYRSETGKRTRREYDWLQVLRMERALDEADDLPAFLGDDVVLVRGVPRAVGAGSGSRSPSPTPADA